jgi:hypothetical protein
MKKRRGGNKEPLMSEAAFEAGKQAWRDMNLPDVRV